jgi:hypothetical protein
MSEEEQKKPIKYSDEDLSQHPWLPGFDRAPTSLDKIEILKEVLKRTEANLGTASVLLLINGIFTIGILIMLFILPAGGKVSADTLNLVANSVKSVLGK